MKTTNNKIQAAVPVVPAPTVKQAHYLKLVAFLLTLLGNVILLPIRKGEKRPALAGWQRLTLAEMSNPTYVQKLNAATNIGVLLGCISGNLCTIDIDSDGELVKFLALNPKLAKTLQTKGQRGGNVWIRVLGKYPKLQRIKMVSGDPYGEWRADGGQTVIAGVHPSGVKYKIVVAAQPIEIAFEEIVWPPNLVLPWVTTPDLLTPATVALVPPAATAPPTSPAVAPVCGATKSDSGETLVEKYGEPYFVNENGVIIGINESYWAGLLAEENILLFEPKEQRFYCYDSQTGIYEHITEDILKYKLAKRILDASREQGEPDLMRKRTDAITSHVITMLRGIVQKINAFKEKATYFHAQNGMVQLSSAKKSMVAFSPHFYSRQASTIRFDPKAECPRFLNEFLLPAVEPDGVLALQKYFGMCLLGDNLAQRLLILKGDAGLGKSQMVNIVRAVLGDQNVIQLRPQQLEKSFELSRFMHRSLLIGADVQSDYFANKSAWVVKSLVGGDWHNPEIKNSNEVPSFAGTFCLIVTSNTHLQFNIQGDGQSWARRLLIVTFAGKAPEKRIPNIWKVLIKEEGSGILNWALEGLTRVQADIAEIGDFKLTTHQHEAIVGLMSESESLRSFLTSCVVGNAGSDLTVAEIYDHYQSYCRERNWDTAKDFNERLQELMVRLFNSRKSHCVERDGAKRGYKGVKFI